MLKFTLEKFNGGGVACLIIVSLQVLNLDLGPDLELDNKDKMFQ